MFVLEEHNPHHIRIRHAAARKLDFGAELTWSVTEGLNCYLMNGKEI